MEDKGEDYKVELIKDLPEDEVISFYKQGDFTDLCAGPHMESTGQIKAVKLQSVAGAYWREMSTERCSSEYTERVSLLRKSSMNILRDLKRRRREITERSERKWIFSHFTMRLRISVFPA